MVFRDCSSVYWYSGSHPCFFCTYYACFGACAAPEIDVYLLLVIYSIPSYIGRNVGDIHVVVGNAFTVVYSLSRR